MPFFVPRAEWDRLHAEVATSRKVAQEGVLSQLESAARHFRAHAEHLGKVESLLRELGEAKAEAERWKGAYETVTAQLEHAQEAERAARREAQAARVVSEEKDPWAVDAAELARVRADMETHPEETLLGPETGRRS